MKMLEKLNAKAGDEENKDDGEDEEVHGKRGRR